MSFICHSYVLTWHLYVTRMYSYAIRMSLVCTRVSSLCHSYVLVCHLYVTCMYLYIICMSLVCGFTMNPNKLFHLKIDDYHHYQYFEHRCRFRYLICYFLNQRVAFRQIRRSKNTLSMDLPFQNLFYFHIIDTCFVGIALCRCNSSIKWWLLELLLHFLSYHGSSS